ncbi:DUF2071 domain-containing protein [bacterium]|nr:DUF2071 domain-containing protein [bacterium]
MPESKRRQRPFLTARWQHLAMLNYEVPRDVLEPLVPRGTELDLWQGRCFVSLVGFMFLDTKVLGLPIPFHRNFEELNLRFYVAKTVKGELRRGVVFVKELVPRWAIATIARVVYGEPYSSCPMRHTIRKDPVTSHPISVGYDWKWRGRWNRIELEVSGEPCPLESGTEEEFITEHYWGYTRVGPNSTREYQVEHPPWKVWRAKSSFLDAEIEPLYGPIFAPYLTPPATSALLAEGSDVAVYPHHSDNGRVRRG